MRPPRRRLGTGPSSGGGAGCAPEAIANCDRKLANYRALLDHEDAVTVAASWIADTQHERKHLERRLGEAVPGDNLTTQQVKALVTALKDIVTVLADADQTDKAELYDQLGVSLTYVPNGIVTVRSQPRGVQVRIGGGRRIVNPRTLLLGGFTLAA